MKAARSLTFKCVKCHKSMQVYLQKVSACSHIQPYQGICECGELSATPRARPMPSSLTWSRQTVAGRTTTNG